MTTIELKRKLTAILGADVNGSFWIPNRQTASFQVLPTLNAIDIITLITKAQPEMKAGDLPYHQRTMRCLMQTKLVVSNPSVMMGKPVIAGTRISVELVLEKLAAGETVEQILSAHPRLTREGIQAALAFAAEALRADVVYPTEEAMH